MTVPKGRKATEYRKGIAQRLYRRGQSFGMIAEALDVTPQTVDSYVQGLPRPVSVGTPPVEKERAKPTVPMFPDVNHAICPDCGAPKCWTCPHHFCKEETTYGGQCADCFFEDDQ